MPDDQLSLAIGKEGQNARLAARLTGWHIDIKPPSFAGESLVRSSSMLIDEEEDGRRLRAPSSTRTATRCRNHARPDSQLLRRPCRCCEAEA